MTAPPFWHKQYSWTFLFRGYTRKLGINDCPGIFSLEFLGGCWLESRSFWIWEWTALTKAHCPSEKLINWDENIQADKTNKLHMWTCDNHRIGPSKARYWTKRATVKSVLSQCWARPSVLRMCPCLYIWLTWENRYLVTLIHKNHGTPVDDPPWGPERPGAWGLTAAALDTILDSPFVNQFIVTGSFAAIHIIPEGKWPLQPCKIFPSCSGGWLSGKPASIKAGKSPNSMIWYDDVVAVGLGQSP